MLESEELLDVLLGIAKLNIAQTGFLQMTESWDSRTENIGRSNDRGYGVGNRSNSFSNSASSEWVSGIASDPDRSALRAYWMVFLEVIDQSLLFPPLRAILALCALVGFGHELLNTDDGDGFERRDDVYRSSCSVSPARTLATLWLLV